MKPETEQNEPPIHRRAALRKGAAVFVLAVVVRAVWLGSVAVEHFDEGVYASNIFFGAKQGFAYPARHLYAPPLVPFVIEWSITFLGTGSAGTLLPSVLVGAMTVVLAWHAARKWFGEEAGPPTVCLALLSDFHIVYSRTALTDVWLGFFLLLAVFLGTEALRQRERRLAIAAGVASGLAWWCKYNGWLAIAITATGAAVWMVVHRKGSAPKQTVVGLIVMAIVAVLVWLPVVIGLNEYGGYEAVATNHARYVVGFAGWFDSAAQQLANHRALDGLPGWSSLALAVVCALVWQLKTRAFTWNQSRDEFEIRAAVVAKIVVGGLLLMLLAAGGAGTAVVLLCCGVGGIAGRIRWPAIPAASREGSDDEAIAHWTLPCWVVAVWIGSLLLVTPMYRPYPRLTMPLLIAAWLGAGAGISWWVRANLRWHGRKEPRRPVLRHNTSLVLLTVLAAFVCVRNDVLLKSPAAWERRDGMRTLAEQIKTECAASDRTVVYTYGEPALFFHLNAMGVTALPVNSLPTAPGQPNAGVEYLVVEGPHARRSNEFAQQWSAVMRSYEKVKAYDVPASTLVRLNHPGDDKTQTFHVWRVE